MENSKSESRWILDKKNSALQHFNKLQMPSTVYGLGIFANSEVNLNNLDIKTNQVSVISKDAIVVNFNNPGEYESLIKEHFQSTVKEDENKLTALHYSKFNGILIYIPKNKEASPIQIDSNLIADSIDHILIVADTNSRAYILDSAKSTTSKFRSQVVEIIAKENAKIDYISLQNLSRETTNFTIRRALVEKDASVNWFDYCLGSKFSKITTTTNLNGQGAASINLGIFFGDKTQLYDIQNSSIHNSSFTKCDMLTKGVLKDKAKAVYRGLIKIQPNAPNSEGYQKEETMLIGEDAEADAVPILEIHNDNVKCKHGTSIGQLDKEKLFYMTSRGLDEDTAKAKIIEGFFESMMSKLPEDFVNLSFREIINERLKC